MSGIHLFGNISSRNTMISFRNASLDKKYSPINVKFESLFDQIITTVR